MDNDRYAIYCPDHESYAIGPITLREVAEMLANIAIHNPCEQPHVIELVEDYESNV